MWNLNVRLACRATDIYQSSLALRHFFQSLFKFVKNFLKKDFNTSVKYRTVTIPNRLHSLDTEMQKKFPVNALGCGVISSIVVFLKAGHERCLSSTTEQSTARRKKSWYEHMCPHTCTHVRRHGHARMYTQLCTCVPNSRTCPHKHAHTGTQPPTHTLGRSHSHFAPIEYMSVHLGSLTLC